MKIGKLDHQILKKIIFDNITRHRDEVMVRPKIGEDCAVIDFGEYACVLSTDPITGTKNEMGRLAVHISCNDIASSGVEPLGLLLTIMAPEGTTAEMINQVMKQAGDTAAELNVEIIGGHTEITSAVNRMVVSATAIGRQIKNKVVNTRGAMPGDQVIMTKNLGLEGTAILAYDWEERLKDKLGEVTVENAKMMMQNISVIKEGVIGSEIGATSMHDITEGGLLGAIWEMCEASRVGVVIYKDQVNIAPETIKICELFQLDPFKLTSSGCMVITIPVEKEEVLLTRLKEKKIEARVIGEITEHGRYFMDQGKKIAIAPPQSDELYKTI